MKRIFLALLFCGAILEALCAGTRNLIMPIDWGKENIEREFSKPQLQVRSEEFGAITQALMAALLEKAAPIIVSSATWGNLIARGTMYRDAVQNRDMSYLQRYPLFSNPQNIAVFKAALGTGYDPKTDLMFKNVPDNGQIYYYYAYQLFLAPNPAFKPQEWIIKKLSDYLYLLIPLSYVQELEKRQDTPAIARQLSTPLSDRERLIGMKVEKFSDIPASTLLDMNAHPTQMKYSNYQNLVPQRAFSMVQRLLQYKWEDILKGYLFSQHLVYMLPRIFVTHTDLKYPGGNSEETDINETYFLHEWLVYLGGHGSPSQPTPVLPVVYDIGGGGTRAEIAFTAGIEQGAFREILGFLNNQVDTGSLIYFSCYSGGPHLFKLFEHNWDYPVTKGARIGKGKQAPKEVQTVSDVFNYLIIATNQFYIPTYSPTLGFWFDNPNYWPRLPGTPQYMKQQKGGSQKPNGLEFDNYFRSMAQLLHPVPKVIGQKNGAKKQKIAQMPSLQEELIKTISYVHNFDFSKNYMVPAIRMPYTEWFVSLADLGDVLRLETQKEWQEREQQKAQAKMVLEERLKKKVVPQKVQESIKAQELASPAAQEKARLEKERLEKEEKDRKERELFDRMEKMRKEQEERDKAKLKPAPVTPHTGVPPVVQPPTGKPIGGAVPPVTQPPSGKPPVSGPTKPSTPVPPVTQAKEPLQPISPNIPEPSAVKLPLGAKPPLPSQLPPPVVTPPGTKPVQLPSKLPPPPQIPFPGQSLLSQALKDLENALKNLTTRLR